MKKIIIFLFSFLLVGGLSVHAYIYNDIIPAHKYYQAVDYLSQEGIISGYPDGTYKPFDAINRAEMLKILVESEYDDSDFTSYGNDNCFNDVPSGEWYTKYVCFGKEMGIVEGYNDGSFRPSYGINLVEALKISMEVFNYDYEDSDPWYKGLVDTASEISSIPLDFSSFGQPVNRGQIADMITRILKYENGSQKNYLNFTKDSYVTYDTLTDEHLVEEDIMASISSKDENARKYYENFGYPNSGILYTVVLYSFDAVEEEAPSCMQGYYIGNWQIDIVSSYGEKIGQADLGKLIVPPSAVDGVYALEMDMDNNEVKHFMLIEEYGDCSGNLFGAYEFSDYLKEITPTEFDGMDGNKIYAASSDDIYIDNDTFVYKYYDNSIGEYVTVTQVWYDSFAMFIPE